MTYDIVVIVDDDNVVVYDNDRARPPFYPKK